MKESFLGSGLLKKQAGAKGWIQNFIVNSNIIVIEKPYSIPDHGMTVDPIAPIRGSNLSLDQWQESIKKI